MAQQESSSKLQFTPIPIFSSNYVWLTQLSGKNEVYITDPGDAEPVLRYLANHNLIPKGILITHSHQDHIGGIDRIKAEHPVPVYGPACGAIPQVDIALGESDKLTLWPGVKADIMHLPGHLPEHIAFFITSEGTRHSLLCGDILFSSGCGRMFTGPAPTYYNSLSRVAALPEDTEVYGAHEYTLDNIRFAAHIEPQNTDIDRKRLETERRIRESGCSLPTTIGNELLTNPFLRADREDIKARLASITGRKPETDTDTFAAIRRLKDVF